jgi:hypothetical protein
VASTELRFRDGFQKPEREEHEVMKDMKRVEQDLDLATWLADDCNEIDRKGLQDSGLVR